MEKTNCCSILGACSEIEQCNLNVTVLCVCVCVCLCLCFSVPIIPCHGDWLWGAGECHGHEQRHDTGGGCWQNWYVPPHWPGGKVFTSRAVDLVFTPVATLPGASYYWVSAGAGWSGVSILWLGEIESLILWLGEIESLIGNFYLSVAACAVVWADRSPRYASMLLGCWTNNNTLVSSYTCWCTGR